MAWFKFHINNRWVLIGPSTHTHTHMHTRRVGTTRLPLFLSQSTLSLSPLQRCCSPDLKTFAPSSSETWSPKKHNTLECISVLPSRYFFCCLRLCGKVMEQYQTFENNNRKKIDTNLVIKVHSCWLKPTLIDFLGHLWAAEHNIDSLGKIDRANLIAQLIQNNKIHLESCFW